MGIANFFKKDKNSGSTSKANQSFQNELAKFYNHIFPRGDFSRKFIENQIRHLTVPYASEKECLETYVYCMSHYLVNQADYEYVKNVLPVAHPIIRNNESAKKVAAYTFLCAITGKDDLNASTLNVSGLSFDQYIEQLEEQIQFRNNNKDKNKLPYEEDCGWVANKPMYFHGARAAEEYLNGLLDLNGRPLHIGGRQAYSVDGIYGMVDCYEMLDVNNKHHSKLYVSIYGRDDYQYVPKGYLHKSLANQKKQNGDTAQEVNTRYNRSTDQSNNSKPNADNQTSSKVAKEQYKEDTKNSNQTDNKPKTVFCRKCGTKLNEGEVFCRKCGTRVL